MSHYFFNRLVQELYLHYRASGRNTKKKIVFGSNANFEICFWDLLTFSKSVSLLSPSFFRTKKTTFARKEWKMVGLFQVERRLKKTRNGFSVYKKTRKRFHCIWVSKSTNQFIFLKVRKSQKHFFKTPFLAQMGPVK